MPLSKNSPIYTIIVATLLCIVCATMVSSVAVALKETQEKNKALDKKKNILTCAGLIEKGADEATITEAFSKIEQIMIDMSTGEEVDIDPKTYDSRKAVKNSETRVEMPAEYKYSGIQARSKYSVIYLVKEEGEIKQIILPVFGQGLWSTLYGFLALENDTKTVTGFAYYEHGETPGLGGEVDNPKWKKQWVGKEVYNSDWESSITVVKGTVDPESEMAKHQVDGLAGATITGNGVGNSMKYWLSDHGYGPFLAKIRNKGAR